MYSLGLRLSSGASDVRIMNSLSSRCIRNGTQASPLSIQIVLSFGNRSGMPLISQLVMCSMLHQVKPRLCTAMKRLVS